MAVEHLSGTLQVYRYTGGKPKPEEFLDQLIVDNEDDVKKRKTPSPRVDVIFIDQETFADAEEPSEAFVEALNSRLDTVAAWLNKQSPALFKELRDTGFQTRFLFTGWIHSDQLDLDLPPSFLTACGRLGLTISVITND